MDPLDNLLRARRAALTQECNVLATLKLTSIEAIRKCDTFISSATDEAAYGNGIGFFGRMRAAGEVIPKEFELLDSNAGVKSKDRRVQPYIRSQLFIALAAELEDYFLSLLIRVLEANPDKAHDRTITLQDALNLGSIEAIISASVRTEINGLFYKKPLEYRKRIDQILMMPPNVLDPYWVSFVELKARRDLGVHGNWNQNETYLRKLSEAGGTAPAEIFLGIDSSYFSNALTLGTNLIKACNGHCQTRFANKEESPIILP
jgi:hypothetical protein